MYMICICLINTYICIYSSSCAAQVYGQYQTLSQQPSWEAGQPSGCQWDNLGNEGSDIDAFVQCPWHILVFRAAENINHGILTDVPVIATTCNDTKGFFQDVPVWVSNAQANDIVFK